MRLRSLRLKDFRGVAERKVEFAERGVTIVEGPNEVGKSTLAEALDLLLDKLDSSTDRAVRAVQPAGRDVGSEVEAELAVGPYRLTYFKRFNKSRATVLSVAGAAAEEVTGREAHERADEILAGHLDLALWRALRVSQDDGGLRPELSGATSLLAALDRAAAGSARDGVGREEALFDRVREELGRYFTAGRGQPTGELREALAAEERARDRAAAAGAELAALEADVERADELDRRLVELRAAAQAAEAEASAARARRRDVERLDEEARSRRAELADEEARLGLLAELAEAETEERDLAGRLVAAVRQAGEAAAAAEPAEAALAAARATLATAEGAAEAARRAAADGHRRRRLAEVDRTLARLAQVEDRRAALARRLAADRATDEALAAVERAERERASAQDAQAAASGRITLAARRELALEIGGESARLAAGERLERAVTGPLRLVVADLAEIEVTPGRDAAVEGRRLAAAEAAVAAACQEAGAGSVEAARAAHRDRHEVETAAGQAEALAAQLLDGRSREALADERATLAAALAGAGDSGGEAQAGPSPEDLDAASRAADAVRATRQRELAAAERRRDELRRAAEAAERTRRDLDVRRQAAADRAERAHRGLGRRVAAGGGAEAPLAVADQIPLFDDRLPGVAELVAEAGRRAEAAHAAFAAARERLAAARPEEALAAATRGEAAALATGRELRRAEDERIEVRARLELLGERGLFDAQADARSAWAAAERAAAAVRARAAAARALHDALAAARDRARAAYAGPLAARIGELGRPLFGPDFAVELDERLAVARRTLGGVALDFDQLSAGAREQIALLTRLAAALLVAPGEGVPLLVDDALGHTDPERLAAVGEALRLVGEQGQVIVLTSSPDRFRTVLGARRVRLEAGRGGGGGSEA